MQGLGVAKKIFRLFLLAFACFCSMLWLRFDGLDEDCLKWVSECSGADAKERLAELTEGLIGRDGFLGVDWPRIDTETMTQHKL